MSELVLLSNHVFLGTGARTQPLALGITGGKIDAVLAKDQAEQLIAPGTIIKDWGDATLAPGFNDAHQHVFHAALFSSARALEYCGESEIDCAWALYHHSKNLPWGAWAIGHGWREMLWKSPIAPTRLSLDSVFPNTPAVFYSGDAHTIWLNTCGLMRLGITKDTEPPAGGSFDRDQNGELTGVIREGAGMYYMAKILETLSCDEKRSIMADWLSELNRRGVIAVSDMGLSAIEGCDMVLDDVWRELDSQGKLTVRGHLFPTLPLDGSLERIKDLQSTLGGDMLRCPGAKQFFDGVSSQHTAWLHEPYTHPNFEGDCGRPALDPERMRELVLAAAAEGIAVRIHTIGDRAVSEAISIFEEANAQGMPLAQGRNCLEHIENLMPEDVQRMADARLVASVQPQHVVIDIEQPERDLGPERAAYMWPFKDFIKAGVPLAFGTDAPCVPMDPAAILRDAITRQDSAGEPAGGWLPEQRVSAAQALRALSYGSAVAEGRGHELGTLEPGKLADVVALSVNPLECPPNELHMHQVLATYVGGKPVFEA